MGWLTVLEIIATVTGILCVYLQTKEKVEAWLFGIISVSLLCIIYFDARLYSDLGLHLIYILLNVYGWYSWSKKDIITGKAPILSFTTWDWSIWSTVIILGTALLGFLMSSFTDADVPFFDAFTTSGSLVAQYLLARKFLQNWVIWIVVDVVAINLYIYKELYIVAFLFLVYLILCIVGYRSWKKSINKLPDQSEPSLKINM